MNLKYAHKSLNEIVPPSHNIYTFSVLGEYLLPYYIIYLNCDHPLLDKYKTENDLIKNKARISFIPSSNQKGTFFHELAHYLQAIATSDGIRNLSLFSRLFDIAIYLAGASIYDQIEKRQHPQGITLRIPILKSLKKIRKERDDNLIDTIDFLIDWYHTLNDDIRIYQGFEITTENSKCSPEFIRVSLIEAEIGIHSESVSDLKIEKVKTVVPLVEVGYNGNIVKKVILGSRHINEGSARVISNIFGADRKEFNLRMSEDLFDPSLSDYNIAFRLFADALKGSGHFIAEEFVVISELALMCANANISAGFAFVMILQLLKSDNSLQPFHPSNPIKFTRDMHNKLIGIGNVLDFPGLWERQKNVIMNNMNDEWSKEWEHLSILSGLFCRADAYRESRGGLFYPILLDLLSSDGHKKIFEQLPLPIVCYNNGKIHYGYNEPAYRMDAHFLYNLIERDFLMQLLTTNNVLCPLYRLCTKYGYLKNFCHFLADGSECQHYSLLTNYENRSSIKCLFWDIADKHLSGWGISNIEHVQE